jgi:hypothetical protein
MGGTVELALADAQREDSANAGECAPGAKGSVK